LRAKSSDKPHRFPKRALLISEDVLGRKDMALIDQRPGPIFVCADYHADRGVNGSGHCVGGLPIIRFKDGCVRLLTVKQKSK
jgi:hypothetical protein